MFRICLSSSVDLPTVVYGFTYPRHWIYLPSSPDLPTIVTGFTYRHLRIYLPSSPDLPTAISRFTYHRLRIYLPSSQIYLPLWDPCIGRAFKNHKTLLCLSFFHQLMFNLLCLIRIVPKRKINLGPVYWKSPHSNITKKFFVRFIKWDHNKDIFRVYLARDRYRIVLITDSLIWLH